MSKTLKRAEQQLRRSIQAALPLPAYFRVLNMLNALRPRPHRLLPHSGQLYEVRTGDERIIACRRTRHRLYKKGVANRIESLAREYSLNCATVKPGGSFIDCGANVGELGFWAKARGMQYVAFEPEPLEARCIDLNHFSGKAETHRTALWHRWETLEFFSDPETADSSVFDTGKARLVRPVEALPLDEAGIDLSKSGTHILKLEAEGAEPEILDGAKQMLKALHYVAADCGYERGRKRQHTFVEVSNRLLPLGYRPVAANLRRGTVLYESSRR